jgi:hypothetical protein
MPSKMVCCTLRASSSCCLVENPLIPLLRLGPTGSRPIRIHTHSLVLFRTWEGMLPIDMNSGHNFLSPEKFVRNVWSEVRMTGMSVQPTGRVIWGILSVLRNQLGTPGTYLRIPPPIACMHVCVHSVTPRVKFPNRFPYHMFRERPLLEKVSYRTLNVPVVEFTVRLKMVIYCPLVPRRLVY